jgi:hypothetical protein
MKGLIIVAALGLALAAATVSNLSCSVDNRSPAFACTKQLDCSAGRTCISNFCVLTGDPLDAPLGTGDGPIVVDARIDAPPPIDGGPACPPGCTTCDQGSHSCNITCDGANSCMTATCPQGWNCSIKCSGAMSCRVVDCQQGKSCDIACTGQGSCRNFTCGNGKCNVGCTGDFSCARNLDCQNSCQCDVACTGNQSCASGGQPQCPGPQACTIQTGNSGCTSAPPGCSTTCP